MSPPALAVFISSTSQDLRLHRQAIQDLVLEQGWRPVMMEHFGTAPEPTVEACQRKVRQCDLVILVVAFHRGWVPTREQGGDARRGITAYELEAARQAGIPVRVLLARDSWPGSLWEDDQEARHWVRQFRESLNQIADFFECESIEPGAAEPIPAESFDSRVRRLLLDHRDWLRVRPTPEPGPVAAWDAQVADGLLRELTPILSEISLPPHLVLETYRYCAPPRCARLSPVGEETMLHQAARHLAGVPREEWRGLSPLLMFIRLVSCHAEGRGATRLRAWTDRAIASLAGGTADPDFCPKVKLSYDAGSEGAVEKADLPFVIGVFADLSGHPRPSAPGLAEREVIRLTPGNFSQVFRALRPRLGLRVPDRLADGGGELAAALEFHCLDDFGPGRVVERLDALREYSARRDQLAELRVELEAGRARPGSPRGGADGCTALVAEHDRRLAAQLGEIVGHPAYRRLKATWCGLKYLVDQSPPGSDLVIRVLNVTRDELLEDFESAGGFERTALYDKVVAGEYGMPGGKPYGLLLGDYEFAWLPEDLLFLRTISAIAASAHAPFVAAAGPRMFDLDRFDELEFLEGYAGLLAAARQYGPWRDFRDSPDSRYVALTLPRVLARLPHGPAPSPDGAGPVAGWAGPAGSGGGLWMSAAWAYAVVVANSFARHGWFDRIHGSQEESVVRGLPRCSAPVIGSAGPPVPSAAEVVFTPEQGYELANFGFLPLVRREGTGDAVFLTNQSCVNPSGAPTPAETAHVVVSGQVNNILCVSRFAHYLKAMGHEKQFGTVEEWKGWVEKWLGGYVGAGASAAALQTARRPLVEVRVNVERQTYLHRLQYKVLAELRPALGFEAVTAYFRVWHLLREANIFALGGP
ncbi:MAG TPA: type VI secretion system contractile sheath large subunit [Gemmataceae bacterium]|nr:type VI secretion system contractile sheath large subunit [Gemmataceae bacterium]